LFWIITGFLVAVWIHRLIRRSATAYVQRLELPL